jgi:hypothetical protein
MPAETAIMMLADLPGARITVEPKDNAYFVIVHAPEPVMGRAGLVDEHGRLIPQQLTRVISLDQTFFDTNGQLNESERAKILADKVPQMLKLLEEALSIDGDATTDHALIKLHQATNTLIVRGTPDQLATVDQVMKALAPTVPSDEARTFAAQLQQVQMKEGSERALLMRELTATKEAQARSLGELAALRAELAEKNLRAAEAATGTAKPAGDNTSATPASKP